MEAVQKAIEDEMMGNQVNFMLLSKAWSAYCLEGLRDEALTKGLALSKALVDFHFSLNPDEVK